MTKPRVEVQWAVQIDGLMVRTVNGSTVLLATSYDAERWAEGAIIETALAGGDYVASETR